MGQSKKLEQLAEHVVEMDKRLAALKGRMEGFLAAGSAFGSGVRGTAKLIEAATKDRLGLPPGKES